jgi:hypothetical protein
VRRGATTRADDNCVCLAVAVIVCHQLSPAVEDVVLSLHALSAICLAGPYTLKSGVQSPFYIDLRRIVSYPQVLKQVSEVMYDMVRARPFDVICGVPYTALPIATLMASTHAKPMVRDVRQFLGSGSSTRSGTTAWYLSRFLSLSLSLSLFQTGWFRDLTEDGIEPNPGPPHCLKVVEAGAFESVRPTDSLRFFCHDQHRSEYYPAAVRVRSAQPIDAI